MLPTASVCTMSSNERQIYADELQTPELPTASAGFNFSNDNGVHALRMRSTGIYMSLHISITCTMVRTPIQYPVYMYLQ